MADGPIASRDHALGESAVTSGQSAGEVHPAKLVDALYVLADLLIDADRVLDGTYGHRGIWRDLPADRADVLEHMLGGFDFLMTSKAVRAYADAWQAELDAEGR